MLTRRGLGPAYAVEFSVTRPLASRPITRNGGRYGEQRGIKRVELIFRPAGTEYFHTADGKLFANASLDRDILGPPGGPGPRVKIQVRCVVWTESTGRQYVQTDVLTVDILDEDDNPPAVQGDSSVAIALQDFTVVSMLRNAR